MKHRLIWVAVLLGFTCVLSLRAEEMRTWTDKSGKFQIEAEFLSRDGSKIRLRLANGKRTSIPIQKLSEEDREYIESLEENPFLVGMEEEEEEEKVSERPEKPSRKSSVKKSSKIPNTDVVPNGNTRREKKIIVGGDGVDWSVQPEVVPIRKITKAIHPIPVRSDSQFTRVNMFGEEALFFGEPACNTMVFAFRTGHFEGEKGFVEKCSLAKGDAELIPLPMRGIVTDMSLDGKALLCICETPKDNRGPFYNKFTLAKLEFQGNRLVIAAQFRPYYPSEPVSNPVFIRADIDTAWFITENQAMTGSGNTTTLWNLETCRSIWSMNVPSKQVTLSPDRKLMVVVTQKHLEFRNTQDGKLCGTLRLPDEKIFRCAFDPTGGKLAVLGPTALWVYDLTDGNTLYDIPLIASQNDNRLLWTGEKTLLIGSVLYDLESGVPLCDYGIHTRAPLAWFRGRVWLPLQTGFRENRVDVVLGMELPHPEAAKALEKIDVIQQFAVYPGVSVKLTIETNDFADEEEARKILTDRLAERKIQVADDASVEVILRYVDTGKEEEISYDRARTIHGFPVPRPPRSPLSRSRDQPLGTMKLKVFEQSLEFVENGETIWRNFTHTTGPNQVKYNPEKTIEDTFREVNKPNTNYVNVVPVPGYVSRSTKGSQALLRGQIHVDGSVR
ncbi:MAG: SHD1 domain-containing protein [Planctomycetia bacterium]|nr:SHD1 domain-containing protein [Planctomycetia bacterium]